MNRNIAVLIAFLVATAAAHAASDAVVPVEQEPQHATIFRNEFVQAFRVRLEPGQATLFHRHEHDDSAVRLSANTSTAQAPGEAEGAPQAVKVGDVTARANETKPTVHRVRNVGTTRFDVIDVQALRRPPGAAAAALATPVAENPKMRMYRYELAPGASAAAHTHARPYLLVAVTAIRLRTSTPDGASSVADLKPGDVRWVDDAVTHGYGNQGGATGIVVEFELR